MTSSAFPNESLICKTTAGILIVLISIVSERVALAQCPDCTGEIKRTDDTGQCHSCFPCPECIDGYSTSSVPCGATVPYWTDIHCVEILQHPQESSQTSHAIFATTANLVISATSSLVHAGSSTQNGESWSTNDPNTESKLPPLGSYSNWKKQITVFILGGISLIILFLAFASRFQEKSKGRSQSEETTADALSSLHPHPVHSFSHQNYEACPIDIATSQAVYQHGHSSEMGDNSFLDALPNLTDGTENICSADRVEVVAQLPGTPSGIVETPRDLNPSTDKNALYPNFILGLMPGPMVFQQPQNQLLSPDLWPQSLISFVRNCPVNMGVQSSRTANWSVLTKKEKYDTKIFQMPFQLLHHISLLLDIQRGDGKDRRLLAEKLGLTILELEVLQQAIITLNVTYPVTYVLLKERFSAVKPKGTVGDLVDILREMEREDIVNEINDWSE